jgi:mannosylglycerate hydrolase
VDVSAEDLGRVQATEVKGTAIVVPHTHWDREWYAPLETMRFHLVRFFDELLDTVETDPDLPTFLLDGQAVIIEDYLEVRRDQRDRVARLVAAGRLRPGPNYVQPDEFHVSGEALVRNLLLGCQVAGEFGWVMREGYLPDTFGHVHQLPQILRGFGIETFYAMRGFCEDPDSFGSQFWWEAPDGSAVLVEWLTESYSNAAVLAPDPDQMRLHHGAIVRYDSLAELLQRLGQRAPTGVLLLLNGGDHLRMQGDLPAMVRSLNAGVPTDIRLGGLEEFHQLVASGPLPETVLRGELSFAFNEVLLFGGAGRRPS